MSTIHTDFANGPRKPVKEYNICNSRVRLSLSGNADVNLCYLEIEGIT